MTKKLIKKRTESDYKMRIFNIYFTGNNSNTDVVLNFRDELLRLGKSFVKVCTEQKDADMLLDISGLDATANITEEAITVISTANGLAHYEKKRKKIIKKGLNKILLASSNEEKAINRKNIN